MVLCPPALPFPSSSCGLCCISPLQPSFLLLRLLDTVALSLKNLPRTPSYRYSGLQLQTIIIQWLKGTDMDSFTVLTATSPESRCAQGRVLSEALRENPFQASVLVSGGHQQSTPFLAPIFSQTQVRCLLGLPRSQTRVYGLVSWVDTCSPPGRDFRVSIPSIWR